MKSPLFSTTAATLKRSLRRLEDLPFGMFEAALYDRLADIKRREFAHAVIIDGNAAALRAIKTIGTLESRTNCAEADIEHFPYQPESLDLIVCCGGLHTVNDLPGVLVQMRRALKPDGLFLGVLAGGETLHELRDCLTRTEVALTGGAAPRVHPMVDLQMMSGLMQRAGFALPVVDADIRTIYYKKLRTLLKDIKASGEGLALAHRSRRFVGKTFWDAVETDYRAHHAEPDGLLRASFEAIYAIGWAPAEGQQKPLKPGSAKTRLADALGTTETKI